MSCLVTLAGSLYMYVLSYVMLTNFVTVCYTLYASYHISSQETGTYVSLSAVLQMYRHVLVIKPARCTYLHTYCMVQSPS